jgi:hypothetical protein
MHPLTEVLLVLFLAVGITWFAVDLRRKLRQPAPGNAEPKPDQLTDARLAPAPEAPAAPAPVPVAALTPPPVTVPAPAPVAVAPAPAPAPAPQPTPLPGVPASHLAVITASIHHLFKGRARIGVVLPAGHAFGVGGYHSIDWAREGRRDIFSSHRVR